MNITSQFNLQSKTACEIKGLFLELFNTLANKQLTGQERDRTLAIVEILRHAIAQIP